MSQTQENKYCIELSSNKESIQYLDPFIEDVINDFGLEEQDQFRIRLCLTEAVNNAIFHGNNEEESKKVCLSANRLSSSSIAFTIKDEGQGFNHEEVQNPTTKENIEEENGRGIFLINELCDCVQFQDNGSTLTVEFKLNNPSA